MFSTYRNFANQFNTIQLLAQTEAYENGDEENREYLTQILREAHFYINDEINEEDLSFEVFDIVMKMVEPEKENLRHFLKNIDPENITKEDFVTLNNVLLSINDD